MREGGIVNIIKIEKNKKITCSDGERLFTCLQGALVILTMRPSRIKVSFFLLYRKTIENEN